MGTQGRDVCFFATEKRGENFFELPQDPLDKDKPRVPWKEKNCLSLCTPYAARIFWRSLIMVRIRKVRRRASSMSGFMARAVS